MQKELLADNDVLADTINAAAKHILNLDIKVAKIALESNIIVSIEGLGPINKGRCYPKNLNPEVKTGRYSVQEDLLIRQNWEKLRADLKLTEDKAVADLLQSRRKEEDDEGLGLKRNIIGYYLCQGLQNIRLATEVYQRARTILSAVTGDWSEGEDEIIRKGRKEGKTWTELSTQLGRADTSTRYKLLTSGHTTKGTFTVEDESTLCCMATRGHSHLGCTSSWAWALLWVLLILH